ncbi:hypothetical protein EBB07_15240 [Paenibacillaceae bacterium]|nr:hypothetical protein EBB07_15240 [Paenibacillaceae bacterium]
MVLKRLVIYALLFAFSYCIALASYWMGLLLFYRQTPTDIVFITFSIGMAFVVFLVPVYSTLLMFLRVFRRHTSLLIQTLLLLVPSLLAIAATGPFGPGLLMMPFSNEASLFYFAYGVSAVCFSLASWQTEKLLKGHSVDRKPL